eukprot:TRINITY_DN129_c1_g4_i5.p1 TRINITY_DN129_c1_g4~~TRINITY_DN129_c1_g4_i5.p1  ORF type:complete len:894 (-),score=197.30 TRINITY_DN129_c1_g4_i5:107-2788(-)
MSQDLVKIQVKCLESANLELEIPRNISVLDLKGLIEQQKGVPINSQRLIFRGRVLKDSQDLSSFPIENGTTIHLVARAPEQDSAAGPSSSSAPTTGTDRGSSTPSSSQQQQHQQQSPFMPQAPQAPHGLPHFPGLPPFAFGHEGQAVPGVVMGTFQLPDNQVSDLGQIMNSVLQGVGIANAANGNPIDPNSLPPGIALFPQVQMPANPNPQHVRQARVDPSLRPNAPRGLENGYNGDHVHALLDIVDDLVDACDTFNTAVQPLNVDTDGDQAMDPSSHQQQQQHTPNINQAPDHGQHTEPHDQVEDDTPPLNAVLSHLLDSLQGFEAHVPQMIELLRRHETLSPDERYELRMLSSHLGPAMGQIGAAFSSLAPYVTNPIPRRATVVSAQIPTISLGIEAHIQNADGGFNPAVIGTQPTNVAHPPHATHQPAQQPQQPQRPQQTQQPRQQQQPQQQPQQPQQPHRAQQPQQPQQPQQQFNPQNLPALMQQMLGQIAGPLGGMQQPNQQAGQNAQGQPPNPFANIFQMIGPVVSSLQSQLGQQQRQQQPQAPNGMASSVAPQPQVHPQQRATPASSPATPPTAPTTQQANPQQANPQQANPQQANPQQVAQAIGQILQASHEPGSTSTLATVAQSLAEIMNEPVNSDERLLDRAFTAFSAIEMPAMLQLLQGNWASFESLRPHLLAFLREYRGGDTSAAVMDEFVSEIMSDIKSVLDNLQEMQGVQEQLLPGRNLFEGLQFFFENHVRRVISIILDTPEPSASTQESFSTNMHEEYVAFLGEGVCVLSTLLRHGMADMSSFIRIVVESSPLSNDAFSGIMTMGASLMSNNIMRIFQIYRQREIEQISRSHPNWQDGMSEHEASTVLAGLVVDAAVQRNSKPQGALSTSYKRGSQK